MKKVDLASAASCLDEYWSQEVVGEANGSLFKVAKGIGSTTWHRHESEDEVFVVLNGQLTIQLRDGEVELGAGDLFVVPRGVEHRPVAEQEVHLLLVGSSITSTPEGGKPAWSSR